jgi:hypothetical protein
MVQDHQGVHFSVKEKLAAPKLLKECNEAKFALLEKCPKRNGKEIRGYSKQMNKSTILATFTYFAIILYLIS